MTPTHYDPWSEQAHLDTAIEKGAVYTHAKTGWKFKVRHVTPWSKYVGRASTLVYSRSGVIDANKKRLNGMALTADEQQLLDDAELEIGIRSTIIDWSKSVTGPDRKPLEMTIANAMMLASKLPGIWHEIQAFSINAANFGVSQAKTGKVPAGIDASGNSPDTSDTAQEDSRSS